MLLNQVEVGSKVKVKRFTKIDNDALSLMYVGVYPKGQLLVKNRLYRGHMIVIESDGVVIAMRGENAKLIEVEDVSINRKS